MQNLQQIAQVLKSNGTDGELILGFRSIAPEDIDLEEPVFIYYDGLPVPFFIEKFSRKGQNKALVRLTGINSYEDAEEIAGYGVYADADSFEQDTEEDFSMLEGWTLLDQDGAEVGRITGYLDIPGNPCIEVKSCRADDARQGTGDETMPPDVIVPLHEDLILSVDEKKQELTMSIPAGLI